MGRGGWSVAGLVAHPMLRSATDHSTGPAKAGPVSFCAAPASSAGPTRSAAPSASISPLALPRPATAGKPAPPPPQSPMPTPAHLLLRELRRHLESMLLFDGHASTGGVRFIIDDPSGRLVMAVEPVVLSASEFTLFVPEERDGAPQLMLSVAPADPASGPWAAACDRWQIYHGRTTLRGWAVASIECARRGDDVIDADDLAVPNPLTAAGRELRERAGANPAALIAACNRQAKVPVADPVIVGIDPWGVDVRARFGIVRLEFAEEAATPDAAGHALALLLAGAPGEAA